MPAARIALLGRLSIDRDGRVPPARGLPGRRAELVFAYLAAEHNRVVRRDELADALWPETLPDTWAPALRGVLTEVRRFLEQGGLVPAEVLVHVGGGFQLRLPPGVVVDLDEARAGLAAARDRLVAGDPAAAASLAGAAAALAALAFLPEHEGDWVDGVRDELGALRTAALELAVGAHAEAGDRGAAAAAAEQLVRAEPYSEPAHRLRIRALGELGDRAGAAAAYEHCRTVLAAGLGIEPSAETAAALRRALEEAAPAAPASASAARGNGFAALSVLVVEDHDFQRHVAVQLLRGLGVGTIAEAADGGAALEAIARSGPPDVILSDLQMPGMDGVEFLRRVAERGLASGLIVVTAMDPGVIKAVEALAEAYELRLLGAIEKPVTAWRLEELLAAHQGAPAADAAPAAQPAAGLAPADVDAALTGGHVALRLRPLVELATGAVSGAEAVPGWHDGEGRLIGPDAILSALDGAGADAAARFAEQIVGLASREAAALARTGSPLEVAVTLPPPALGAEDLADRLAAAAGRAGAGARSIVCALAEPALTRDRGELLALTRLRLKGFGVALARHGTAGTPAEHLARLPLTALKADRALVSGAADDAARAVALDRALGVARTLGLAPSAAGCDTARDFELLLRLGCRHADGAFVAEPMGPVELAAWSGRWTPAAVGGPT